MPLGGKLVRLHLRAKKIPATSDKGDGGDNQIKFQFKLNIIF
jgi:hypothetical protein